MISKRRGKPSNNQLKTEVRQQVIDLIYGQFERSQPVSKVAHNDPVQSSD
jgi:hypothetical protein